MSTVPHASLAPAAASHGHGFFSRYTRELSVAAAYALLLLLLAIFHRDFFHKQFHTTWVSAAPLLIMAVGMTLVILARHIDISIGSQFSVCGVVAGLLAYWNLPLPVVVLGTVLAGAIMGAANGALVAGMGMPSIVVTLATMVMLRGALMWASQGAPVVPAHFQWLGRSQEAGQGIMLGTALVIFLIAAWAMRWLVAGRTIFAVGSDPEAARLAGIRPRHVVFWVFVLMGALTGVAALINAMQFMMVFPNQGEGNELTVIAAVVVGGVAITGGRGTLLGVFVGVALLATIGPALQSFHVSSAWVKATQGLIILLAVSTDALQRRPGYMSTSAPLAYRSAPPAPLAPAGLSRAARQQFILLVLIVVEVIIFSFTGTHFFSSRNFFEVLRESVELGLLALALTPVIVTGGIDLSVGSLLGLCAILMGMMWKEAGVPLWLAAVAALLAGTFAGGLNALLITRLRIPALIVTLGTFSLYRGIAEGITGGAKNYTRFPDWFTFLGQRYIGPVPAQLPIFIVAAIGFWVLLHRSAIGRSLSAIGYAPEGARHAGIPVDRRVALTYILAGFFAALAGIVYTSHHGQAKADAGTWYELKAITAVVLGGTSIFGGRGSILGTLLALFVIAILGNGLGLSDYPRELTDILTGAILLVAIGLDRKPSAGKAARPQQAKVGNEQELDMRNSQLAVLSIVILLGALIVAGGNFLLVRSIQATSQARGGPEAPAPITNGKVPSGTGKQITIAMMPKSKGNPYFIACQKGAEDAAKELNVKLLWDGPTDPDPAKQNEVIETWITRGVDVIAVAVENRGGISTVLRKAREKGIKVVTWDADADEDARDFFVNQATPEGMGEVLMKNADKVLGGKGDFAIITASLTADNMVQWQKQIARQCKEHYPDIKQVALEPCDDKQDVAFNKANVILNTYPNVKLIMAICSPAAPGAAEAVKQSGRKDVRVVGVSLPNLNKTYVHDGITEGIVLWNTADLGYLAIHAAYDVQTGKLKSGATSMDGGRIGKVEIQGTSIILGKPFTFTKENIDQYDF